MGKDFLCDEVQIQDLTDVAFTGHDATLSGDRKIIPVAVRSSANVAFAGTFSKLTEDQPNANADSGRPI
jgi:hypothetical protein